MVKKESKENNFSKAMFESLEVTSKISFNQGWMSGFSLGLVTGVALGAVIVLAVLPIVI